MELDSYWWSYLLIILTINVSSLAWGLSSAQSDCATNVESKALHLHNCSNKMVFSVNSVYETLSSACLCSFVSLVWPTIGKLNVMHRVVINSEQFEYQKECQVGTLDNAFFEMLRVILQLSSIMFIKHYLCYLCDVLCQLYGTSWHCWMQPHRCSTVGFRTM